MRSDRPLPRGRFPRVGVFLTRHFHRHRHLMQAATDDADGVALVDAAETRDSAKVASLLAAGMVVRTVDDASRLMKTRTRIVHKDEQADCQSDNEDADQQMTQNDSPFNVIAS